MASIKVGDAVFEITDPNGVVPVGADIFTECRYINGLVRISLAAIVADGDGKAEARVVSRVRISLATAMDLRNAFDGYINDAAGVPEKEKLN